jgi:hypothetical protein
MECRRKKERKPCCHPVLLNEDFFLHIVIIGWDFSLHFCLRDLFLDFDVIGNGLQNYRGILNHRNTPEFVKEFEQEHQGNSLHHLLLSFLKRMVIHNQKLIHWIPAFTKYRFLCLLQLNGWISMREWEIWFDLFSRQLQQYIQRCIVQCPGQCMAWMSCLIALSSQSYWRFVVANVFLSLMLS